MSCSNVLTDRCRDGWLVPSVQLSPAEVSKDIKRKWLQQKQRKLTQRFLLAEVRMSQNHQTSRHPPRKFKGETSEDQHQQMFR